MIKREDLTIIIPVYNEEQTIEQVLIDVQENYYGSEIIVVDDGSTDSTKDKLKNFNIKVVSHHNNKGYGAALKTGIHIAENNIIATIDADGQHDVKDIKLLLPHIELFDMVVGRRIERFNSSLWRRVGKYILNIAANKAVGLNIPDINSGLRVFKKDILIRYLAFVSDTFSFYTTSTLALLFNMHKIKYVPVVIRPRKDKSKISMRSGIISLSKILILSLIFKPARGVLLILYMVFINLLLVELFLIRKPMHFITLLIFLVIVIIGDKCLQNKTKEKIIQI